MVAKCPPKVRVKEGPRGGTFYVSGGEKIYCEKSAVAPKAKPKRKSVPKKATKAVAAKPKRKSVPKKAKAVAAKEKKVTAGIAKKKTEVVKQPKHQQKKKPVEKKKKPALPRVVAPAAAVAAPKKRQKRARSATKKQPAPAAEKKRKRARVAGKKKTVAIAAPPVRRVPIVLPDLAEYAALERERLQAEKVPLKYLPAKEYTVENRNVYGELLNSGQIKSDLCDIGSSTKDRKFLTTDEKDSTSKTLVLFAKLVYQIVTKSPSTTVTPASIEYIKSQLKSASPEVVIKASYEVRRPEKDNSLQIELDIYERFIYVLANWNATPNVMLFLKYYRCTDFQETIKQQKNKSVQAALQKFTTELKAEVRDAARVFDFNTMNMLLLERGKGEDFGDWYREKHSDVEWFSILYQVFYTLQCFVEAGFRHNDLHSGNIWIEKPVKPQYFIYFVTPKIYHVVPITAVVKIYDFDRAYAWQPSTNPRTGQTDSALYNTKIADPFYCKESGQCNERNTKSDAFNVLWYLYNQKDDEEGRNPPPLERRKLTPSSIRTWVKSWFPSQRGRQLLTSRFGHDGQICNLERPKAAIDNRCNGDYEPTDSEMHPILYMLKTGFRMFERSLPEYDPRYTPIQDFPNIFKLPSVGKTNEEARRWEDSLEPENIRPVSFDR